MLRTNSIHVEADKSDARVPLVNQQLELGALTQGLSRKDQILRQMLQTPWFEGEMDYYDSLIPNRYQARKGPRGVEQKKALEQQKRKDQLNGNSPT